MVLLGHMSPMAGGIADGKEYGLVLRYCTGEGFIAPGIPVDGVMDMLQEVGGFLINQSVCISYAVIFMPFF